ncbi:MAG: tRNA (adenosine(37)-N6)-dimethylallyltransferase MiaA [Flavobacteriaceae bacterium]|nr:tRNA (adenosine(37)-N6)-dimethylallyltransferase MiaA [Flavobacteriaceae bacterium]
MQNKKHLICIVGPTAIGKTALSIKIANHFSTEIISADSRQFYKEMKIGTAVPTTEELAAAPHHFIQNRSIFENYSVGDFEKDAIKLLDILFKKHPIIIMVGGSGLYIDAVVKGLDKFPDVPEEIKKQLIEEFEKKGIESLQKELKEKDPVYYNKVDLQNHHRVIRALGVCRTQELPYSSFLRTENTQRNFETIFIGLTAERKLIYNRINQRIDIMVEEGLIKEAEKLHQHKSLNALQTVGYRELFSYFEGNYSKEQAIEEIKKNTRRFAKRQGTWFRKNDAIKWFDYQTNISEVINFIENTSISKN